LAPSVVTTCGGAHVAMPDVASAQASLRTAQLRLQDLLDGSTDADLAAAFQAVEQARAALSGREKAGRAG